MGATRIFKRYWEKVGLVQKRQVRMKKRVAGKRPIRTFWIFTPQGEQYRHYILERIKEHQKEKSEHKRRRLEMKARSV